MTRTVPRMTLPERTPEEREADRQRALRTLEDIRDFQKRLASETSITASELDAILDDMHGRSTSCQ